MMSPYGTVGEGACSRRNTWNNGGVFICNVSSVVPTCVVPEGIYLGRSFGINFSRVAFKLF